VVLVPCLCAIILLHTILQMGCMMQRWWLALGCWGRADCIAQVGMQER
jgi:hypothetical protein